ncbi:MAG TPA: YfhO family protein [Thermoanaerobaculia bacterium]|nr:YfhO family protein [Thermoanaerobaculia bacterium]
MLALVLYVAVTVALIAIWRRFVHPISNAAAIALILLPLCFTGRALLTGRVYAPIDLPFESAPLSNYKADYGIEAPHHAGLSDLYMQLMPWQSAVRHALAQGEWPVWNPYLLCGSILAANMQAAPYDAVQLLGLLLPHAQALTFAASMAFFLAALFTFAFLRTLGCSEPASLIAAAGYTFCAILAFFVGWPLGRVWTFLPLVFLGVRLVVYETNLRAAVVLTASLVLTIFAGHPESILHIVFCGAIYGLYEVIATKRARPIALAALCGVLALLLTAISILPFLSVAPHTVEYRVRREQYAPAAFDIPTEWITKRAAVSLFPFAGGSPVGGQSAPAWEPTSMRVGSVILALAILSVFFARRWFFFAFAVVMACAGLNGFPVGDILHALPLFDIALNERLGFAAVFAICVLAAFALDAWPAERKRAFVAAGVVLTLGIALGIGASLLRDGEIRAGTDPAMIATLTLAELLPLAILAVLFALRVKPRFALPLVLALVLVQRVVEDGGMYPSLPEKAFYPEVPIFRHLQNDTATPFRVAGLYYAMVPDTAALYGLEDPRGYEAMTFERLHETYPLWCDSQPVSFNIIVEKERTFLSFLNVKYVIGSRDAQPDANWKLVMEDRESRLLENTRVMPRVFIPRRIRYEQTDDAVIRGMKMTQDFAETAWITAPAYVPHEIFNGPGTLTTRREGLAYEIDADLALDSWVVISDSKWPGWRAYIDGRRVETQYANHAFIGLFVPKGKHHLRVVFQPEAFTRGRNITLATIGVLVVLGAWRQRRRRSLSS